MRMYIQNKHKNRSVPEKNQRNLWLQWKEISWQTIEICMQLLRAMITFTIALHVRRTEGETSRIDINKKDIKKSFQDTKHLDDTEPAERNKKSQKKKTNYDSFGVPRLHNLVCVCNVSWLNTSAMLTQCLNFHLFLLNFCCATMAYRRVRFYRDLISLTHILHMLFIVALAQSAQSHAHN